MRWPWLVLIGLAHAVGSAILLAEQATTSGEYRFKYERYDAPSGALYKSSGFATNNDDNVDSVFVDSSGRLWVGTVAGLAVYDGNAWTNRTFPVEGLSPAESAVVRLLQISHCGPEEIAEGPPATIWLGGLCGLWRFRDGVYEELNSNTTGMLSMAVDREGGLWVVERFRVLRYSGQIWTTALCPYIGKPASSEAPGFYGIVIETNGNVWIGATAYREPNEPWEHEGTIWTVDQEHKTRSGGPPMAPLFEFDGKRWRAFGPPHGLNVKRAIPELNEQGRIVVKTSSGYYIREGGTWKPVREAEIDAGKRWVLRERRRGLLRGYSELLFRDGQHLVEVQPANAQTGEVLDVRSEQLALLHIAEDRGRSCVWLGSSHGLYRIWREKQPR
jgi:ligand-binding sensor domain-containing protein